jgi:hypothetical protein
VSDETYPGFKMNALFSAPMLPSKHINGDSITEHRQLVKIKAIAHSMASRQTCPCCAAVLLRHMRSSGLYWRCNSCYQEMPVL